MALGVNASRKREPDQFKRRGRFFWGIRINFSEHDASHFDRTHASLQVHFVDQGDSRKMKRLNVR